MTELVKICKPSFNLIRQINRHKLIDLGYSTTEIDWFTNFGNKMFNTNNQDSMFLHDSSFMLYDKFKNIHVNEDGHSKGSQMYTQQVVLSMLINSYNTWTTNCVHMNYEIMFDKFYVKGFSSLGNRLLIYNFKKKDEFEALTLFNKNRDNIYDPKEIYKLLQFVCKD